LASVTMFEHVGRKNPQTHFDAIYPAARERLRMAVFAREPAISSTSMYSVAVGVEGNLHPYRNLRGNAVESVIGTSTKNRVIWLPPACARSMACPNTSLTPSGIASMSRLPDPTRLTGCRLRHCACDKYHLVLY